MNILGLRLGNTNTTAFVLRDGYREPWPVVFNDFRNLLPTVACILEDGNWVVGRRALEMQRRDPEAVAMGSQGLPQSPGDALKPACHIFRTIEPLAAIMAEVRRAAEEMVGEIKRCVLCVPAHFNLTQQELLRRAVEAAGLEVERCIADPIAAIIGSGLTETARSVLVVRMGGQSFEAALVSRRSPWAIDRLVGDPRLGGVDIDNILVDWFLKNQLKEIATAIRQDVSAYSSLQREVEQTKIRLSRYKKTLMGPIYWKGEVFEAEISLQELELLITPVLHRIKLLVGQTLNRAEEQGRSRNVLDAVLLTGGCALIPSLKNAVEETVGVGVTIPQEPELVMTRGAALAAAELNALSTQTSHMDRDVASTGEQVIEVGYEPFLHNAQDLNKEDILADLKLLKKTSREIRTFAGSQTDHFADQPLLKQPQPILDENVQFTVYRPRLVAPEIWYPLVAFAHLAELPPDTLPEDVDPVEEVKRQAKQVLADKYPQYQELVQDSVQGIPREGELTFLPEIPGCEFNPPRRTFLWQESVHREEFRMRAPKELDGQTVRGRLSVFLGCILVAEIPLSIKVNRQEAVKTPKLPLESAGAKAYRKIFASYSRKDIAIVNEFEQYLTGVGLGDKYMLDLVDLRGGEEWSPRLMEMIREANIFQLFWSRNSMVSPFVEQEWRYALSLQRPYFVRPAYWEEPLPELPEKNLPPEELRRLHFVKVAPRGTPAAASVQSDEITTDDERLSSFPIDETLILWDPERGKEPHERKSYPSSSPVGSSPIKMPPAKIDDLYGLARTPPVKLRKGLISSWRFWVAVLIPAILTMISFGSLWRILTKLFASW